MQWKQLFFALEIVYFCNGKKITRDPTQFNVNDLEHKLTPRIDFELILFSLLQLRYKVRGESSQHTGQAICGIAEQEGADCVVIACRGLGPIKKAMMGSVSEYVVRHANRPVLVVPHKKN